MGYKLITITKRVPKAENAPYIHERIESILKEKCGFTDNDYDYEKFKIINMSQSLLDDRDDPNNEALLYMSFLIEM